ncbi:hypothetical protein QTJ16_003158 [Diplocarpon rosae]|uniref:Uncharacterized protein n=1 Tax=Diplocarpon rosae TaxID=946125 RepID=A0AAD9T143_9HELO|nr:hypothetical protein QTJ16_003158 [Diplocarpon rosae]
MKPSALLLLATSAYACMEFNGSFPFSPALPFEARIVDNGVTTCWIATTYAEHLALQQSLSPARHTKRSAGRKIALAARLRDAGATPAYFGSPFTRPKHAAVDEEHVDLSARPLPRGGLASAKYAEEEWEERMVWAPWQFECLAGYQARANVGLRSFVYAAHGQEFYFVPKVKEDIWGEKWVYGLRLWCRERDKSGNPVAKLTSAAEKKEGVEEEEGAGDGTGNGVASGGVRSGKGGNGQGASVQAASGHAANAQIAIPNSRETSKKQVDKN